MERGRLVQVSTCDCVMRWEKIHLTFTYFLPFVHTHTYMISLLLCGSVDNPGRIWDHGSLRHIIFPDKKRIVKSKPKTGKRYPSVFTYTRFTLWNNLKTLLDLDSLFLYLLIHSLSHTDTHKLQGKSHKSWAKKRLQERREDEEAKKTLGNDKNSHVLVW